MTPRLGRRLRRTAASGAALAAALAVGGTVWRTVALARAIAQGRALAAAARAFRRDGADSTRRVLVVGDSTGVGTGAECPAHSVAGRLAADYPHASIDNRCVNGARTVDALAQLRTDAPARHDAILIHVGGNDVLRGTPSRDLACSADALIGEAAARAPVVAVTTTPNVGLAPLFFPPLSWWLSSRARRVRDLFAACARRHGAVYVDLFHPRRSDPFSREPATFYATDRLHPSAASYRLAYAAIRAQAALDRCLGARGSGVG